MQGNNEEQFQLAISGSGLLFIKQISYQQMRSITQLIIGEKPILTTIRETIKKSGDLDIQPEKHKEILFEDVSSFLDKSNAHRSPDKIVALVYLEWKKKGESQFSKDDIKSYFQQAKLSLPKNLNRDIRWAEKNNWIAESPNQTGFFYLTQEGIAAVEARFPRSLKKKTVNAKH